MYKVRHLERRETLAHWQARAEESGESVGLVSDMNLEGINIHSDHEFTKGQQISLRITVDPKICGTDHIVLLVENVWSHRSGVSHLYHAGFRIITLSSEARVCLNKLLLAFSYPAPHETY